MNKLEAELQRLYFLPGQEWHSLKSETDSLEIDLITATGLVRCFVVSVENGCAWSQVAALYEGVQDELDLPAPAISVSVEEGYQIWFSLAEPVALQLAQEFMGSLIRHYLTETKATKLKLRPGMTNDLKSVPQVPAKQDSSDRWSAYIDPTMGSMFVEETWLEMAPNRDKQAAMLAGLKSIGTEDFDQASKTLQTIREKISSPEPHPPVEKAESAQRCPPTTLGIGGGFSNPKSFLLAVMNDSVASAEQRMAAAVALLPFFENDAGK